MVIATSIAGISIVDRTTRQKADKETEDLYSTETNCA